MDDYNADENVPGHLHFSCWKIHILFHFAIKCFVFLFLFHFNFQRLGNFKSVTTNGKNCENYLETPPICDCSPTLRKLVVQFLIEKFKFVDKLSVINLSFYLQGFIFTKSKLFDIFFRITKAELPSQKTTLLIS